MKRRCSAVKEFSEFYQMTQAQQQKKKNSDSRLRKSQNLGEMVKHIRPKAHSWKFLKISISNISLFAKNRTIPSTNLQQLRFVYCRNTSILTNDKGSDHGKNYEKFFEKLHEKIFSWPWPCSSLWWLGYAKGGFKSENLR